MTIKHEKRHLVHGGGRINIASDLEAANVTETRVMYKFSSSKPCSTILRTWFSLRNGFTTSKNTSIQGMIIKTLKLKGECHEKPQ